MRLAIRIGWGLMVLSLVAGCSSTTDQDKQPSKDASAANTETTTGTPEANQLTADSDAAAVSDAASDNVKANGLGVTTDEMHAAEVNLQRYIDVDSVMYNLMMAKYSPSLQAPLALLGINPTGKDSAKMLPEAIVNARRFFINQGNNMDVMASTGVLNLFSPEDLIRLSEANPEELEKAINNVFPDQNPSNTAATSDTKQTSTIQRAARSSGVASAPAPEHAGKSTANDDDWGDSGQHASAPYRPIDPYLGRRYPYPNYGQEGAR